MAFPHDGQKFQEGQSGNPDGRPAGSRNRSTLLRKWLDTPFEFTNPETGELTKGTLEDAMVLGQIAAATNGGPQFKEILDSVYGKQTDKVEVSAPKKTVIKIGGKKPESDAASGSGDNGD